MSLYIFTKNLRLRAQINTQLQKGCICATDSQSIHTVAKKILADPHPVLIVDENFHERGILPFVEYCISEQIPGPKIFIPKQRKEQSEYVSAGGVAILHRPFTIEQLIICAISVSSIEAVLDHISVEMKKTIEKNYCKNWYSTFLVGESDHIKEVRKIIQQIGNRFKYVHINGESGTGKELIARAVHKLSDRSDRILVKVNCSALPSSKQVPGCPPMVGSMLEVILKWSFYPALRWSSAHCVTRVLNISMGIQVVPCCISTMQSSGRTTSSIFWFAMSRQLRTWLTDTRVLPARPGSFW